MIFFADRSTYFCCIFVLDGCFAHQIYFSLLYFSVRWMFCSQIHKHSEEQKKKVATFLRFFIFLPYLDECFALISTYFCCIFVLDESFAIRSTFLGCIFLFEDVLLSDS